MDEEMQEMLVLRLRGGGGGSEDDGDFSEIVEGEDFKGQSDTTTESESVGAIGEGPVGDDLSYSEEAEGAVSMSHEMGVLSISGSMPASASPAIVERSEVVEAIVVHSKIYQNCW